MITITIYQNQEQVAQGFRCIGHAGYANVGEDIVCSAVSVLVINTINSIEVYTDAEFDIETEEETGLIAFRLKHPANHDETLLIDSMILGLQGIQNDYGKEFLILEFKEV